MNTGILATQSDEASLLERGRLSHRFGKCLFLAAYSLFTHWMMFRTVRSLQRLTVTDGYQAHRIQ